MLSVLCKSNCDLEVLVRLSCSPLFIFSNLCFASSALRARGVVSCAITACVGLRARGLRTLASSSPVCGNAKSCDWIVSGLSKMSPSERLGFVSVRGANGFLFENVGIGWTVFMELSACSDKIEATEAWCGRGGSWLTGKPRGSAGCEVDRLGYSTGARVFAGFPSVATCKIEIDATWEIEAGDT